MSDESNKRKRLGQDSSQPFEDRALKAAMKLFGNELLPVMGVKEAVRRIAPTEQIHLEVKSLMEDFNFEMEDGTWRHFEFESDSITDEDLRRFRAYEAMIGFYYGVEVETCVICTALARKLKKKLKTGRNVYRVRLIRMKDRDADQILRELQERKDRGELQRADLIHLLLTPLMSGETSISYRIEQGIRMLQNEHGLLDKEDLMRMEAILYTFAVKFVTGAELKQIQEVVKMTLLGQMLVREGEEKGIRALIETCQKFGNPKNEVCEELALKFSLTKEKAEDYLKQYWK